FREAARLHLVEVSNALRGRQAQALARYDVRPRWHARIDDVPTGPCLIVANEFFDCLPIRQFVRVAHDGRPAWRERLVGAEADDLAWGLLPHELSTGDAIIPPALHDAPVGAIAEHAPALSGWADLLAERLKAAPGRALILDYAGDGSGDTLQAVRAH